MATKLEINNIMIHLQAAYPDWKPKNLDATLQAYEEALIGFPVDLLRKAADRCRDTCLFMPKMAEMRKAINEIHVADIPNTSAAYMEKIPISPEIQKHLADFRKHMEDKGMWKEARPAKIS